MTCRSDTEIHSCVTKVFLLFFPSTYLVNSTRTKGNISLIKKTWTQNVQTQRVALPRERLPCLKELVCGHDSDSRCNNSPRPKSTKYNDFNNVLLYKKIFRHQQYPLDVVHSVDND